jgi:pyruvate dehydrogenase E2 component (dihydrolipoamide acetyltransferase)
VDGKVTEILINKGDDVKIGQVALKIEAAETAGAAKEEPKQAKTDAKELAKAEPKAAPAAAPQPKAAQPAQPKSSAPAEARREVPAAPSVKRFAREIGIDIGRVSGTGPGGRISVEDVKAHAKQVNQSGAAAGGGIVQKPLPDFSKYGTIEKEKMSKIRQVTANHMTYCWTTIPHVTQFAKADITDLDKLRKRYSTPDRKLTVTPFILKVITSALKIFPQFNASIDMINNEIVFKKYYNIGVAVDTDRGLLVPVLRNVDKKSVYEITDELNEMAERARNKRTTPDELTGGTFTLTNLGGIYGTAFTPIVNAPEVAILGLSRGAYEQVYRDGQFITRLMLPLSLSYDHRIIDGADGARFIKWICEAIEQPFMMELEG